MLKIEIIVIINLIIALQVPQMLYSKYALVILYNYKIVLIV